MRAERRKIQNRVNQRTYRDGGAMQASSTLPPPPPLSFSHSSDHALYQTREFQRDAIVCRLAPPHGGERARQFELAAYRHYMQGTPQVDQLLTLVKLNVYRALAANLNALGMTDIRGWMHPDATSAFATLQPSAAALDRALPKHLQPTAIQRAVPHHPWLDFFPHPRMRDRLIVAGDQFDDEELCVDIMGFWTAGKEDPALIVWGPPWDIANWEMSDAFVRKWGWTVKDCPDLFRATNTWRALRGDKRLCSR
ncbi:uncharacterized protein BO72DRAFT_465007 [Aspergillus fijiensis CBS 313.89]|uniref:BZIP domain-containing protein n=1 Tax=Aspergillus fijiensis CBS 313.89 TaxID=1448319 RepID=A0A8G1W2L6_9EURO|nr:uncharacterized protein BO72DRAFT_465007 [Aspergillus fijiensis CBS 313.89]RAK82170.1 hypothetical protein BO72DRAFT_465007 [Aspergillus fijiensis CBS 313.89]